MVQKWSGWIPILKVADAPRSVAFSGVEDVDTVISISRYVSKTRRKMDETI